MSTFQPFHCGECGTTVQLATGSGRTREYVRGYNVPIPDDFEIPTCPNCGEIYVVPEVAEELSAVLRREFLRLQQRHYRQMVKILTERHGVAQKDIVQACGVTPSYLSHVLAGKRQASVTLTRLLEAFVANPAELDRHLEGHPWSLWNTFYVVAASGRSAPKRQKHSPEWGHRRHAQPGPEWSSADIGVGVAAVPKKRKMTVDAA
jgi:transcriptional regulator with XRE-family HTH domain